MMPPGETHSISFVLRLYKEYPSGEQARPQGTAGPRWRCQVEHVGSGETISFIVPAALLEFIRERMPIAVFLADQDAADGESGDT